MKKIAFIITVLLLVATPYASFGEMYDGNILLEDCKQFLKYMDNKEDPSVVMSSIGYCLGYMQGHIDFQQQFQKDFATPIKHCFPVNMSVSQLAKVSVDYLEKNPNKLNKPAIELTLAAFAESFPCTESQARSSK